MTELTACCAARPVSATPYCGNCDELVGLDGLRVVAVDQRERALIVRVESKQEVAGCRGCGVVAVSHGRRVHQMINTPSFGRPVRVRWVKRTWSCSEATCSVGTFTEQDERVATPRALLTVRACWWVIGQLRREHASIADLARQLGTTWATVWRAVKPLLAVMTANPARFEGVRTLRVDEHIWHHVSTKTRGPKELTGMVDLTRDEQGNTRARLLDLVPGRSGTVYRDWLARSSACNWFTARSLDAGRWGINSALHTIAITQIRITGSRGNIYYNAKIAEGKTPREAKRCLKRRLTNHIWRVMTADERRQAASPGGHLGATLQSSATGSTPTASSSDKSLPEPANPDPRTPHPAG